MMRKTARKKAKEEGKSIAAERIEILFALADKEALSGDIDLASQHVEAARRIAMKFNVRIPKQYRRKYCRYCHRYLLFGKNSNVRIVSPKKRVEVYCFSCRRKAYYPYVAEVRARRQASALRKAT